MEKYNLQDNVKVFGVHVKTFPQGVGEAFDALIKMLPPGDDRPFYGISEMAKDGIIYKAAALETFDGEAEKYGCETYTIEKGEYLAERVWDWPDKTACIKNVFDDIFRDERADKTKPCIEIYKNRNEMLCMVKVDKQKELLGEFESVTKEFMQLISSFSQEQINTIPFEGSWTAAQVAEHIIKSDTGMIKILYGPTQQTTRQPDENIESLKAQFLDFTTKLESPKFIIPASVAYDKETLLNSLRRTRIKINEAIKTLDAGATCPSPVLGELTRLEIFNFIIFHTQRHIHQLKNISQKVDSNI